MFLRILAFMVMVLMIIFSGCTSVQETRSTSFYQTKTINYGQTLQTLMRSKQFNHLLTKQDNNWDLISNEVVAAVRVSKGTVSLELVMDKLDYEPNNLVKLRVRTTEKKHLTFYRIDEESARRIHPQIEDVVDLLVSVQDGKIVAMREVLKDKVLPKNRIWNNELSVEAGENEGRVFIIVFASDYEKVSVLPKHINEMPVALASDYLSGDYKAIDIMKTFTENIRRFIQFGDDVDGSLVCFEVNQQVSIISGFSFPGFSNE